MSEWKQGAAERRDARATKTDASPPHRSHKDTRHWCRGKVGVEHVIRPVVHSRFFGETFGYDICINCRKKVRRWMRTKKSPRARYF